MWPSYRKIFVKVFFITFPKSVSNLSPQNVDLPECIKRTRSMRSANNEGDTLLNYYLRSAVCRKLERTCAAVEKKWSTYQNRLCAWHTKLSDFIGVDKNGQEEPAECEEHAFQEWSSHRSGQLGCTSTTRLAPWRRVTSSFVTAAAASECVIIMDARRAYATAFPKNPHHITRLRLSWGISWCYNEL